MAKYTLRRLVWIIPVIFLVAGITFLMMHAAPGGPWDRDPERRQVDAQTQKLLNARFNLDQPLGQQFISYMLVDVDEGKTPEIGKLDLGIFGVHQVGPKTGTTVTCGALCLNLGPSYRQRGRDVENILLDPSPPGITVLDSRFGYSIRLGLISLFFAIVIGIPLGVISALKQNTFVDYSAMFIGTVGVSVPELRAGHLADFPAGNGPEVDPGDPAKLESGGGVGDSGYRVRLWHAGGDGALDTHLHAGSDAAGLYPHGAGQGPTRAHGGDSPYAAQCLDSGGDNIGASVGCFDYGIFYYRDDVQFPGVGREYVTSISNRDYSMIMATTLLYAVLIALANLSVDLLYAWLDPRIKVGD